MQRKTPFSNGNQGVTSVKWRQHELTLVSAVALIILAGYLWDIFHTPYDQLAAAFDAHHVPFGLYRNLILPDVSLGLSGYICYLWVNMYMIPRLLFRGTQAAFPHHSITLEKLSPAIANKILKKYGWLFIQLMLLVIFLGTVYDTITYLKHEWQFNYPGFSIFFDKNNTRSQLDILGGYFAAASILALFAVYISFREIVIHTISVSKQREYYTLICNKVTAFMLQFGCVPIFLWSFHIIHERQFFVTYFLAVPALFAMFISNVYWLFPMQGNDPFFSKKIIGRLLVTSFFYAMPLIVFVHEQAPVAFLYSWALQLFLVTPITWWYYQTNKEKILQLRIIQQALVKSKADLQFLRSQINPHFLFNVLNTLYGTALQENAERTGEGIQRLGDMMRFMLHDNNLDFIRMDKEIEYLKNYIALQKLRTQSSPEIIIEDNISEELCNHRIAPMLLIPLVENAFKHGISLKERSWIKINLQCTEENILFEVRNSMHEKSPDDPERERSGIGYKNVLERLKLLYPGKFRISVNGDGKEFFVRLTIYPEPVLQ